MQQRIEERGEVAEQENVSYTTVVCRQEERGPQPLLLKLHQ